MSKKPRKEKRGDWVVMGGREFESAYCTRCGQGWTFQPGPVEAIVMEMKAFVIRHQYCQPGQWQEPAPAPASAAEWRDSRDVGTSSMTIYLGFIYLTSLKRKKEKKR